MAMQNLSPEKAVAVDYNFQQIATQLGIDIPPEAAAQIIGVSAQDYAAYTQALAAENAATAAAMLQNSAVTALVDGIAANGKQVLTLGDSITTCRYSYAELLRALLEPRGVAVANWGVGGYTSNHALELCFNVKLRALQADFIFLSYGVNDAKTFGNTSKMLVSHAEYAANMTAVVQTLQSLGQARVVLLTPTPVVEATANTLEPGFHQEMRWDNADIKKMGAALKQIGAKQGLTVVDLFAASGESPDPDLYIEDGLHPNRAGQRLMLEQIADQLKFD